MDQKKFSKKSETLGSSCFCDGQQHTISIQKIRNRHIQ